MRLVQIAALVLVTACLCPSLAFSAEPEPAASLCGASEAVLFTCGIDRKIVSICGKGQGQAVYRFGRPERVEIEVSDLHFARMGFSGGGEEQVQVDTPAARYIVYTEIHRTAFGADGHNDPKSSAGLFVQIGGKTVARHQCAVEGSFDPSVETLLPAGGYIDH